jgi:uncharacterized protein (UPF0548 family)
VKGWNRYPDVIRHRRRAQLPITVALLIGQSGRVLLSVTEPGDAAIQRALSRDEEAELTYRDVGATVRGEMPSGYRHDRWVVDLGPDVDGRFERCGEAVLHWEAQRGAGIRVVPDEPAAPDLTFVLVLRLPLGFVLATARVVHVVHTDERIGFAYGTLPAHPEEGEEIFMVERSDGRVTFELAAFSRPRDPLARLGAPFTRWMQLRTNRTYLDALRQVAA